MVKRMDLIRMSWFFYKVFQQLKLTVSLAPDHMIRRLSSKDIDQKVKMRIRDFDTGL